MIDRKERFELTLTPNEREFVARASWDMGISQAEFMRGVIPDDDHALARRLYHLRKKQKSKDHLIFAK